MVVSSVLVSFIEFANIWYTAKSAPEYIVHFHRTVSRNTEILFLGDGNRLRGHNFICEVRIAFPHLDYVCLHSIFIYSFIV